MNDSLTKHQTLMADWNSALVNASMTFSREIHPFALEEFPNVIEVEKSCDQVDFYSSGFSLSDLGKQFGPSGEIIFYLSDHGFVRLLPLLLFFAVSGTADSLFCTEVIQRVLRLRDSSKNNFREILEKISEDSRQLILEQFLLTVETGWSCHDQKRIERWKTRIRTLFPVLSRNSKR